MGVVGTDHAVESGTDMTYRYMQDRPGWRLTHREIGPPEGFAYFMYLLTYTGAATP